MNIKTNKKMKMKNIMKTKDEDEEQKEAIALCLVLGKRVMCTFPDGIDRTFPKF